MCGTDNSGLDLFCPPPHAESSADEKPTHKMEANGATEPDVGVLQEFLEQWALERRGLVRCPTLEHSITDYLSDRSCLHTLGSPKIDCTMESWRVVITGLDQRGSRQRGVAVAQIYRNGGDWTVPAVSKPVETDIGGAGNRSWSATEGVSLDAATPVCNSMSCSV